MRVTVYIRDNRTKEIRKHKDKLGKVTREDKIQIPRWNPWFIWEKGNYSCDCNRAMFFGKTRDYKCSDGKFSVRIYNWRGKLLYAEY